MILHIMTLDKFTPAFIDFVHQHFDTADHKFTFITSKRYQYGLTPEHQAEFLHTDDDFELLRRYMAESDKIILHGLKRDKVHRILCEKPEYLQKSIWVMWGGDFYYPELYNDDHRYVMKHVPYLVNILDEEMTMVRSMYGVTGRHIRSFFYNTTLFHGDDLSAKSAGNCRILLGHSAVKENQHIEYLNMLKAKDDGELQIFCPLVYPRADLDYIKTVAEYGQYCFGERFKPLLDYVPLEQYLQWLDQVNMAILPSPRQHGMGNLVNLLGQGRKVYLDTRVSTWSFFNRIGVELYPVDTIHFSPMAEEIAKRNHRIISDYFSVKRLVRDLAMIFNFEFGQDLVLEEV